MIIKEERSKDEDRQEGAGVKTFLTKTFLAEVWVFATFEKVLGTPLPGLRSHVLF